MMNQQPQGMTQEAMGGAVPQEQAPQGQPAQGGQKLSPEEVDALRKDPEIVQAVSMVMGRPVDMAIIPDELMMNIAGMVHKLGVEGAVSEFTRKMPPQILQQLKQAQG